MAAYNTIIEYTGSCTAPLTYCKKNVGLVEPERSARYEINTGGGWVRYLPPLRQAVLGTRLINYLGGLLILGGRP